MLIYPAEENLVLFNEHYPKYKVMSDKQLGEKYQTKMANIGQYAEKIFFLAKQNQQNYWYKTVKGILSLYQIAFKEVLLTFASRPTDIGRRA